MAVSAVIIILNSKTAIHSETVKSKFCNVLGFSKLFFFLSIVIILHEPESRLYFPVSLIENYSICDFIVE